MPRSLAWSLLMRRAEAVARTLADAGVGASVAAQVLDVLVEEPPARARPRAGRHKRERVAKESFVRLMERRLREAEAEFLADLPSWQRLCLALLPEAYADRKPARRPTRELAGTAAKVAVMSCRDLQGEQLRHDEDRGGADEEDDVALLYPLVGNVRKPATRGGKHGKAEVVEPAVLQLQGEGRDVPPGADYTGREGPRDPRRLADPLPGESRRRDGVSDLFRPAGGSGRRGEGD